MPRTWTKKQKQEASERAKKAWTARKKQPAQPEAEPWIGYVSLTLYTGGTELTVLSWELQLSELPSILAMFDSQNAD